MSQPAAYRVLVLDDDGVILDLTQAFLSLAGHQVLAFSSSADALAALGKDSAFDLVLTDLNMPGLQGAALARTLRAAMPESACLVGMSATHSSEETAALFDAFLLKPFDPQTLQATLDSALQRRAAGTPPGLSAGSQAEAQTGKPSLDENILESLARSIPPSQLRKLYEMGIDDVERRLARMHDAAAVGDLATVKREAHTIKGSCGMVGALELQALAAAIEDGTTLNTSALQQIPGACLRLRRMLDAKLQTV